MKKAHYYFVAKDQCLSFTSTTPIDAFIELQKYAAKTPIASEFKDFEIEVSDNVGKVVLRGSWAELTEKVMEDTYGPNWREVVAKFNRAVGHDFY